MKITQAATDISQIGSIDVYLKFRGLNDCNQGLIDFDFFQLAINQSLNIIEGKGSNHIILESLEPGTCACAIGRLEWRVAEVVMNIIDDSINVNTIIIDVLQTL